MEEVEVKIINIDRAAVERKLLDLGAKKIFDGEMHAVYYDFPDRSLTRDHDLIRLRKEGDRTALVFKKFIGNEAAKVRDEHEVTVSDFDTARKILECLGLVTWLSMRKHRITYELGSEHIEIDKYHDEYEFIPVFIEIEGKDIDSVHRCADRLGFTKEECLPWTAVDLAKYYSKDKPSSL